jgi:aspartate kinase
MQDISFSEAPIAVIKLGGSILTTSAAYRRAAVFVLNRHRAAPDERLVVVVSAQEGATDNLERTAKKIAREPHTAALDLLWSTGETRSVALLALQLQALGVTAAALNIHETGLNIPTRGEENTRHVERVRLNARHLCEALGKYPVAIVPGFFAADSANAIVSLGRGGSDLTAVLLAEGLKACRCELVKDVPGYFTSDPHRDSTARPIPHLTFERALELADQGCDLVQRNAIEAAARSGIPLVIRSLREKRPISRISHAENAEAWTDAIPSSVAVV